MLTFPGEEKEMSRWVGVVQHDFITNDRMGETLVNLDKLEYIQVTQNTLVFGSAFIKINTESMKHILELLETE